MKPLNKFISFIFIISYIAPIFAQETLTLDSAVSIALDNNYGIKISQNDLTIAENNATKGNAGFWPTVTFDGGGTFRFDNIQNQNLANGTNFSNTNVLVRNLNAGVNLNWTIFDGKKMFATYERLQELKGLSETQLKAQVENTVYNVMLTYYDIVRQKIQLNALLQNIAVSEERLKLEKNRKDFGKGTQLAVTQAELDLKTQYSGRLQQQNAIANAKVLLNQLLSRAAETAFEVSDTIPLTFTGDFETLKNKAFSENTQLRILERNTLIQEKMLKEMQADKLPVIAVNAGYGYSQSANSAGFNKSSNNLGLTTGLTLRWNLFDGGRVKRNIANTQLTIENQRLSQEQAKNELESSILQAIQDFNNAKEVAQLEEENFALARQSIQIVQERFRMGVANTLELKDAQNVLDAATIRRSVALYQAKLAEINLLFLTGQLGNVQ